MIHHSLAGAAIAIVISSVYTSRQMNSMSDFGERLAKSLKQAAEIASGTGKPGAYRVTAYDDDGKPQVIADFSEEVLAQVEAEIAAEREREQPAKPPAIERLTKSKAK